MKAFKDEEVKLYGGRSDGGADEVLRFVPAAFIAEVPERIWDSCSQTGNQSNRDLRVGGGT